MAGGRKYLLIDNYDSFTYNLWHFLSELGADVVVHRNDKIAVSDALAGNFAGIILSPGPCDPDKAGICLELIKAAAGKVPVLGVCLGHQAIGQAFGGRIVHARQVMHGKTSEITHSGLGVFAGLPSPLTATRYHSLVVRRDSVPDCLEITAEVADGTVMGLRHRDLPVEGVQFHPESILTEGGHRLIENFLDRAR